MTFVKLGNGTVGIGEGFTVDQEGNVMIGIMFKNGAGDGSVGSDLNPLTPVDYDVHIMSTSKESLKVLREQLDRAIDNYDEYVNQGLKVTP